MTDAMPGTVRAGTEEAKVIGDSDAVRRGQEPDEDQFFWLTSDDWDADCRLPKVGENSPFRQVLG
jgi:hypothetical protein